VTISLPTLAERPDLVARARGLGTVWPPFMHHDPVASRSFPRVRGELSHLQFLAWDEERDEVAAEANTVPAAWDADVASLPDDGVDGVLESAFAERTPVPNVLCALQIVIAPEYQGRGLSIRLIGEMAELARHQGFDRLIAPVRPTLKHRYPLAPIGRYVDWRRDDGTHLDPWLRTHERFGGEIVKVAPRSMTIPGTIAEWEEWTGMSFPESGEYVVPGALVPIEIDVESNRGVYVEPNVWMVHRL
jgi:GNAT superfamily N-acetyltransferase